MSDGSLAILKAALEALTERRREIDASIEELEKSLKDARASQRELDRAMRIQEKAVREYETRNRKIAAGGPASTSNARKLMDLLKEAGEPLSLGVITDRSGLPSDVVRPLLSRLTSSNMIERTGHGMYASLREAA